MRRQRKGLLILLVILLGLTLACDLSGCEEEPTAALPTETSVVVPTQETETVVETVVVVATPTQLPTEAPASSDVPVLQAPEPSSGDPTVTSLVDRNVRTGPGTNYDVVGALPAGTSAQIVGRSPDGFWWKITCPPNVGNECWTSAGSQYSSATNAENVAVAAVPPAPTHAATSTQAVAQTSPTSTSTYPAETATAIYLTGTPTYTATPPEGATATYTYTPSATATTDVNATPTSTSTSTSTATATYTATATEVLEAPFDNDSLQSPAVSHFMSPTGIRDFEYSDQISYAGGDNDDWIEFEFPNNSNTNQNVWITLTCEYLGNVGNAQVRLTIYEDGQQTTKIVICNEGEVQLTVNNTAVQQGRIHFGITNDGVLVNYTVTVVGYR